MWLVSRLLLKCKHYGFAKLFTFFQRRTSKLCSKPLLKFSIWYFQMATPSVRLYNEHISEPEERFVAGQDVSLVCWLALQKLLTCIYSMLQCCRAIKTHWASVKISLGYKNHLEGVIFYFLIFGSIINF